MAEMVDNRNIQMAIQSLTRRTDNVLEVLGKEEESRDVFMARMNKGMNDYTETLKRGETDKGNINFDDMEAFLKSSHKMASALVLGNELSKSREKKDSLEY